MRKTKNKDLLLGAFIGAILTSVIGVSAVITTNTLSYTPKDSTWNVNTAQGALDSLYDASLTGKNNIISALNSKGLRLDNNSEYNNIVDGINSLPVGKTESGEWGFVPEGETTVQPYKGAMQKVLIGSPSSSTTYNLTSYEGYKNFTNDNFFFGDLSISVSFSANTGLSGGGSAGDSATLGGRPTLSYNPSNGVLTVNMVNASISRGFGWGGFNGSCTNSAKVYLVY